MRPGRHAWRRHAGRVTQEVTDPSGLARTTSVTYTPDDHKASVTQSGTGSATSQYVYQRV